MSDPLSVIASSIAIFDALKEFKRYADDVINAGEEREEFRCRLDRVEIVSKALNELASGSDHPAEAWLRECLRDPKSSLVGLVKTMRSMSEILKAKDQKKNVKKGPKFMRVIKNFRKQDVKWHSEKNDMEKYFDVINTYCQSINTTLNMVEIKYARETDKTTKKLLHDSEKKREEEERREIEKWLSPLDFVARQSEIHKYAAPKTGQWFIDLPQFQAWKDGLINTLPCYGEMGTGKTVLSSIVVDYLKSQNRLTPVLVIYLDKTPVDSHNRHNLIGSLIKQIIQFKGASCNSTPVYDAWQRSKKNGGFPTMNQLKGIFNDELHPFKHVHIVVDSLDAAVVDTRTFIKHGLRQMSSKIRLLTTTRGDEDQKPRPINCDICGDEDLEFFFACQGCGKGEQRFDICASCKGKGELCSNDPQHLFSPPDTLQVTIRAPEDDLASYVTSKVKEQMPPEDGIDRDMTSVHSVSTLLGQACTEDKTLLGSITSSIVQSSNGKFLLAKLYVNSLSELWIPNDIRSAAENLSCDRYSLSDTINNLYDVDLSERISQLSSAKQEFTKRILSIVYYAKRDLRFKELQQALAVREGQMDYDVGNEARRNDILNMTKGFITIGRDCGEIVRFDDRTLSEYFDQTRGKWFPDGESTIARICLTYLNFAGLSSTCEPNEFPEREKKYIFLSYAVDYWGDHVRESGNKLVAAAATKFLQDDSRREAYIQAAWETKTQQHQKWDIRRNIHALHICAWFNLSELIPALFDILNVDVREPTFNQSPLMYACRRGNLEVASSLLSLGASINMKSSRGRSALHEAIIHKHSDMVHLLLDTKLLGQSIDVNSIYTRGNNRTPLMMAIRGGKDSEQMAHALLKRHDIEINLMDQDGYTALSLATWENSQNLFEAILRCKDVDVNTVERVGGRSALVLAAEQGKEHMVIYLLTHYAAVDLRDNRGGTAALRAVERGHAAVLEILMKHHTDLLIEDEEGRTLMHRAAEKGQIAMIRKLESHGVNIDSRDKYGMTPLHRACEFSQFDAADTLIQLGADSSINDSAQRTPFTAAWQYGNTDLMDLCCQKGTNRVVDEAQSTRLEELPIWSLASLDDLGRLTSAVKTRENDFLLKQVGTERTALHCAIINNDDEEAYLVLELLLKSPAKHFLNEPDRNKSTPLHLAAEQQYLDCTRLLLQQKPKINEKDRFGRTPLFQAFVNGHLNIAVALVEAGAEIELGSRIDKEELLFSAIELENTKAVENLMKAGADHISPDEYGRTPKSLARKLDNDAILKVMDPYKSGFAQVIAPRKASTGVRTLTTELRSLSEELPDMPSLPVDLKSIPFTPFKSPQLGGHPWAVEEGNEAVGDDGAQISICA
ncbi:hypothetical protein HYFRA_00013075 [Hymenoscyphus fraxineus]|uniref:Nephrocystin 3-like N-terminal domain-containing protein n=1 Tax=Hymenoscyphus fraxineus TaxID=746836 RepID=A0A9N9L311_9HELO|nr:hypothetical protein HYFRA_00013075 [Hymenoscyphus fraxineus]